MLLPRVLPALAFAALGCSTTEPSVFDGGSPDRRRAVPRRMSCCSIPVFDPSPKAVRIGEPDAGCASDAGDAGDASPD
jgi:hypothetical protein